MSSIIGIPTTRVSDQFVRQRMLAQVQADQAAMYRVLTQLSTGHSFSTPSENPTAAMRVVSLQSLLERKQQVLSNLNTNQSYLSAADSSLSTISSMLADVRATTLGVLGTASTDTQRKSAAQEVGQLLRQLVDTGNQQFRGRYLFAGSSSSLSPFVYTPGGQVNYLGNDGRLVSYGDIDLLFETSVSGADVFGAISEPVRGTAQLRPALSHDTSVRDLRNGQGLSRGSIAVSDGTNTSIIDLSTASTLGDVAALIQANPPPGRSVTVDIAPDRLIVRLDSTFPGSLSIREVGGGTLAGELGLRRDIGAGKVIEGQPLNPVLQRTTRLEDICGTRARANVRSAGSDNDFIVEAVCNGAATADGKPLNGVRVSFVHDPLVVPGEETVVYDGANSLVVHIADGYSRAHQVVAAINRAQAAGEIPFTARLDPLDSRYGGRGVVNVGAYADTAYGSGEDFDRVGGLQIVNQSGTYSVSFTLARTVEDLLNTLNGAGAGVYAEINDTRTGINLRSRSSGADFAIGENGGRTAAQLGLRSFTSSTSLSRLNFGRGVDDWPGSGARSSAVYDSAVPNSSITFTSKNPGTRFDGFQISFAATTAAPKLDYDPDAKTLVFHVQPGVTTANEVIDLLKRHPAASNDWDASLTVVPGTTNDGTGKVVVGGPVATTGGDDSGVDFTITRADGTVLGIDVANKQTIGQILDAINRHPNNADGKLTARLAAYGNGIELIDLSEGTGRLTVARTFYSQAAIDLGLVPAGAEQSAPPESGGRAQTTISSAAKKSGLIISSVGPGTGVNGVRVIFADGGPPSPVYDAVAKTLTIGITAGVTTAADVKAMLAASGLSDTFAAAFDPADDSGNDGSGLAAATPDPPPRTSGGTATTFARAVVVSPGFDNDLVFTSRAKGPAYNNISIRLTAVPGGPTQVAGYNPGVELEIQFDPGTATANDIIAAVAAHPQASAAFEVAPDPRDASPNDGSGLVDPTTGAEPPMTGGRQSITGRDTNPLETESIFTALLRIQQGLETNDQFLIERAMRLLDRKTEDMNFSRAALGARQQGVEVLKNRLDVEDVELQQALSLEYDADLSAVISELTARQAAFQASLQAMAKIYQMSLLDYL